MKTPKKNTLQILEKEQRLSDTIISGSGEQFISKLNKHKYCFINHKVI